MHIITPKTYCMKHSRYLLTMLLIAFLCACTSEGEQEAAKPEPQLPDLVMQIQKQSRLYSTECHVHKIISHNDSQQLLGSILGQQFSIDLPLGKRSVAIPIDATVKAYIDFGEFSDNNVRRRDDQIEIILPDPKVKLTSTKIDHDNVKKYVALLRSDFTDDEISSYEQQGRAAILKAIPEMDIVESARKNAARILIPMIKQMGFSERNITITFRKDLNTQNIIERSTE